MNGSIVPFNDVYGYKYIYIYTYICYILYIYTIYIYIHYIYMIKLLRLDLQTMLGPKKPPISSVKVPTTNPSSSPARCPVPYFLTGDAVRP